MKVQTFNDTIKALKAPLEEYTEAFAAKLKSSNPTEDVDKKYTWKLIIKRVILIDSKT
jgi:hypothetical protein